MDRSVNQSPSGRTYHAPRRTAAAAETRQAILRAAKEEFEARGWAAATIRSIAESAGVSPKTVEALFATKPALLEATLLAVIGRETANASGGGPAILRPASGLANRRDTVRAIEAAPDAETALDLLAALATEVSPRAARLCWAVETAVPSDERLADLWARLTEALLYGVRWSAEIVLRKPGIRADLTRREAEETFLTAIDWNTYRTLTTKGDMSPADFETWIARYYRRMLLATT
jgi:AcrR family transcriptional regulator